MKGSLKGSMINFQDFHLQGSFKPSHFYPFNCPVFTPDDNTVFKLKVQRLKLQNYKAALSEASVKMNRMGSTQRTEFCQ